MEFIYLQAHITILQMFQLMQTQIHIAMVFTSTPAPTTTSSPTMTLQDTVVQISTPAPTTTPSLTTPS
jgi:hypothetical protein